MLDGAKLSNGVGNQGPLQLCCSSSAKHRHESRLRTSRHGCAGENGQRWKDGVPLGIRGLHSFERRVCAAMKSESGSRVCRRNGMDEVFRPRAARRRVSRPSSDSQAGLTPGGSYPRFGSTRGAERGCSPVRSGCDSVGRSSEIKLHLIHVAPTPVFPWLDRLYDRMFGRVEMLRRVLVL